MRRHGLPDGRIPVLLSAHEEELVGQDAAAILDYLQRCTEPGDRTPAVAATLVRTRRVRRHRAVVRAADQAELVAGLRALAEGNEDPLVVASSETVAPRTAFVFPGQGTRWASMGSEGYQRLPAYRTEADRCAQAFAAAGAPSPLRYLLGEATGQAEHEWSEIEIQSAQFTHAVSLARVWQSCGILPDMTVGHSLGEVAAAYVAGAVALPDAVAVVAARATVVDGLPGRYGMAVLGVGGAQAERLIAQITGWLEVSVLNAPSSTVVSGDRDAVAQLVRHAEGDGVFVRELDVDFPAHTSALDSLRGAFTDLLPASAFSEAPVEFIGSARGGVVAVGTDFTDYWWDNLRNTVRFDRAVVAARQRGAGVFVELSAHPALMYAASELVDDALVVGSGRRDEQFVDQLSGNITAAAVANPAYRWADAVQLGDQRLLAGFPNAPMRAVHLWAQPEPLPPPPGAALTVAMEQWEQWEPSAFLRPGASLGPPCGVAVVGPAACDDPFTRRLTEAAAAHPGCNLVAPDDADIAVLITPPPVDSDVTTAVSEIGCAMGQLDYRRAAGPHCRRVWLITTCAESVQPGESAGLPAQAALAAMHRSVGFEFPDTTFAHLDLPRRDIDAEDARRCVELLLGDPTDVAVRVSGTGLTAFTRTLRERREPVSDGPPAAGLLDDVVISGGSGVVGLRYARYCIEQGARRVTLLSRKGVERVDLSELTDGHAVDVRAPACDITDRDAVAAVAGEHGGAGASLLVHAAGVARFGRHDQLSDVDLADVFDAKVAGLVNLTDVWPRRRDCRILLCSSVSGVWGGAGHAGYSAANRTLDVFAAQLRAQAVDCTSVRWGLWPGTAIADADEIRGFERAGLIPMDPDAAVRTSLHQRADDPLIFAADFDRLRLLFESRGIPMFFGLGTVTDDANPVADNDGSRARPVAEVVRAELAAALRVGGPASVDLSAALTDLGVDSLLALDLRKRLRRGTGRSVPLATLLGGITGAELIAELIGGATTEESLESSGD